MEEVLRSACLTVMELVKPLTRWNLHHLAWPFSSSHSLACTCEDSIIIIVSGKHRARTSQGLRPDHWPWDGRAHTRKVTRRDGSLELLRCRQRFDFFCIFHLRGNPGFFAGWRTTSEWKRRDQRKVEEWDHQESPPPIHMKSNQPLRIPTKSKPTLQIHMRWAWTVERNEIHIKMLPSGEVKPCASATSRPTTEDQQFWWR